MPSWWPWIHRRRLAREEVRSSLLRAQVRIQEKEVERLRRELATRSMATAEAMDHGFRMARGDPYLEDPR